MKVVLLIAVVTFGMYAQHDARQTISAARARRISEPVDATPADLSFMKRALALGNDGEENNSAHRFAFVIVRDQSVIGEGYSTFDPSTDIDCTAEINAIRTVIGNAGVAAVSGSVIYTNFQPRDQSLSLIESAGFSRIYYYFPRNQGIRETIPQIQLMNIGAGAIEE